MELGRWFHQLEGDFLFWWDIEPPELCSGHSFWHKLYSITRTSKTTLFRHNHQEKFLQISSLTSVGPFAHYGRWEIPRAALFVVQLLSCAQLFATLWTATHQVSLSFTISQSLLKLMSTESVMPSNHLVLSYPFLLLPSIFPSIRVLSNESCLCIRWPEYWSLSFSINPSNEYSGLISFRLTGLIFL